jgi:hypothetical protein
MTIMITTPTAAGTLQAWYCPALGLYRRPGAVPKAGDPHTLARAHLLTQFEWLPLYAFAGGAPGGWVLRSYYSPAEASFYASHRTMSEKTASQADLLELYAAPGAPGNDSAGHVPPKK